MLKVGLIGNAGSMVSHVRSLKNLRGVQIIGKSSVGLMDQADTRDLSFPEYTRHSLVDEAEALVVDNSSMLLPDLLKIAIKSNKHLFITDLPALSPEQCYELVKLADEARTVVLIRNSLLCEPLTYWIAENWQEPAYLSFSESLPELPDKKEYLLRLLFYAFSLFRTTPQKIRVSGIHKADTPSVFINLRFDYSTYSILNLELIVRQNGNRTLKAVMPGKYMEGNAVTGKCTLNQKETNLPLPEDKFISEFVSSVGSENFYQLSNLADYHSALLTLEQVLRKIELYTPWH